MGNRNKQWGSAMPNDSKVTQMTSSDLEDAQMLASQYVLCEDSKLTTDAQKFKRKIAGAILSAADETQTTPKRFYACCCEDGWEVCARPYSINEEPITLLVYESEEEAKAVRDKFNNLMDEV